MFAKKMAMARRETSLGVNIVDGVGSAESLISAVILDIDFVMMAGRKTISSKTSFYSLWKPASMHRVPKSMPYIIFGTVDSDM